MSENTESVKCSVCNLEIYKVTGKWIHKPSQDLNGKPLHQAVPLAPVEPQEENEPPICARCHQEYTLDDVRSEPSKYCDPCAHERVEELEANLCPLAPVEPQEEKKHEEYLKHGSYHCLCGWPNDGIPRRWHQIEEHVHIATCSHEFKTTTTTLCIKCGTKPPSPSEAVAEKEGILFPAEGITSCEEANKRISAALTRSAEKDAEIEEMNGKIVELQASAWAHQGMAKNAISRAEAAEASSAEMERLLRELVAEHLVTKDFDARVDALLDGKKGEKL